MNFKMKAIAVAAALVSCGSYAASTGGFATADGNIGTARTFTASTYTAIQTIIDNARYNDAGTKVSTGAYPLHIIYTGNEDSLIAQIVKDSTIDANHNCPAPHWSDAYRHIEIKNYTAGVTIEGASGSSANWGIVIDGGSTNVVVKNMKIGALGGASNDADMIRIDSASNVLIDHNELFAVNNECNGSPDGDLTFESAMDIKKDSHNITLSYNYIHDSKKVGLDGSSASDIAGGREITYHHNVYYNVNGRLPLQRGGWTHIYNNTYDKLTSSGINVRTGGYSLIERNWFQNSLNPVTCRYDVVNCGHWDLRNNNATSSADNAKYNITWDIAETGDINADNWTTTAAFPKTLPYVYEPVSAQCVHDKLAAYAGVGKNGATLTAAACGTSSSSSSSSVASSSSSSSVASSSSSSSSVASSSSSSKSSSSSSSSSTASSSSSSSSSTGGTVTIQESTTGFCHVDGSISNSNTGYTGTGYANLSNTAGAGVDWSVNAPSAGNYTVTFRYSNGGSTATTSGKILVNGVVVQNSSSLFSKTASKTTWTNKSFTVALVAGANRIRLEAGASAEFADIDYLSMSGVTPVACQ